MKTIHPLVKLIYNPRPSIPMNQKGFKKTGSAAS